jgi:hypothetical protein
MYNTPLYFQHQLAFSASISGGPSEHAHFPIQSPVSQWICQCSTLADSMDIPLISLFFKDSYVDI